MRHGSTQHCQPMFCRQSSSSVCAAPHAIAQLTRGSCQCNVGPPLGAGRLWTVTYDFFFLAANIDKWPEKWMYCTNLKPSYFGPKVSLLGYEETKTIRTKVTLASCRQSARCSMACGFRSRNSSQCWELILKSLFLIKYYCKLYSCFMLMYHVTFYAFIFATESKQDDLYI